MTDGDNCISTCYYTGGEAGTAVQELDYNYFASLDDWPYYYVYRLTGKQQPAPAPQPGEQPVPQPQSSIDKFKAAGNVVSFNQTAFQIDAISYSYGMWQCISTELSSGGQNWLLNGIPLALVSLTDSSDQNNAQVGNHFTFDNPEFNIIDYDEASNAICCEAHGLGSFWVNADVAFNA